MSEHTREPITRGSASVAIPSNTTTTSVTIGGAVASFSGVNDTELVVVTPPGTAGAADIVVGTAGGSATLTGGFTYVAGPGI
ncbi:glycine cleavage system pyridoxal-binding protein P [Catenulispora sp. GP43]|uniref:IPT/TIG domain-containing protein n=1 Tax=Catenulispora sp. GP43 TaxID=3156263 RepID=UPI003517A3A1